jgi:transcriptional regulator with XRE-family HTH domain
MKRERQYLPATEHALTALGAQVAAARRQAGWTVADLAERLGVSRNIITRIEQGAPGTAVGTVLEAAVVCGVPLFGVEPDELGRVAETQRTRLALLPARVRASAAATQVADDF